MKSPRPKRLRKERVPWEAAVAPTLDTAKKAERKAPRTDGDCVYVPSHGRHQMGVNSGVQWDKDLETGCQLRAFGKHFGVPGVYARFFFGFIPY